MESSNIREVCDKLVDQESVVEFRHKSMLEAFEAYKNINVLLGYFSQLRDFSNEHGQLLDKIMTQRHALISQYINTLTDNTDDNSIFKQILIAPNNTDWYRQGINKFKKVKDYSLFYYRRKIFTALEAPQIDVESTRNTIKTISELDRYYDIYEDTITHFMRTNERFANLMKRHFSEYIHL